ncbi:hypothetical protein THRCLA_20947 [Thraustotheca clavata]|uniref:Uncharacterized protein n=1 Tax=Thraustotheca clavata TaxID=74557 RepID=A0A1W0A1W3_9STRA|nr:hypothetical protein THRCLA_20947 [Thraustotheca clavata]
MADDGYTATELRSRYGRGGTVGDSDLSAAQLRSRYSIEKNTFKDHPQSNKTVMIAAGVAIAVILLTAFLLTR